MSATSSPPPTLNSHEQALVQYRPISRPAIAVLVLGLASPLALVSPLLALVPLCAIVVAVLSLRGIQTSGGQIVGRTPAIAGLCLAALFLGWGVSARFGRALTLESRACQVAEAWLTLIAEGDLQQADQLRMPVQNRMRSAAARKMFYKQNPQALKDLHDFFDRPELSHLIAEGKNARFRYDSLVASQRSTYFDLLTLRYIVGNSTDGTGQPLYITVKRQIEEEHVDWQVSLVSARPDS